MTMYDGPLQKPENKNQAIGGELAIPSGHCVVGCDLDAEEPYCEIVPEKNYTAKRKRLAIPKSLAYYLSTHFCGSERMRANIANQATEAAKSKIREALGILFRPS